MSINLGTISASAVKQFDTEVKQAYQAKACVLAGSYRPRMGFVGDQYNFRRMEAGIARLRTMRQANVTPMDVGYSLVACSLADWDASEYTDIFNQTEVNFSERQELAECIAGAMVRRRDQIIFDAIIAGTYAGAQTIAQTIGGAAAANCNMNVLKLLALKNFMDIGNVPAEDRYLLMHASVARGLLTDPLYINRDYNNAGTGQLDNGTPKGYLGFKFIIIGDYVEGGIPLSTANRYAYAWHKSALGAVFADVQETEVNYIPEKKSWLASGNLRMGSVLVEPVTGCIRVDCLQTKNYDGTLTL